MKSFSLRCGALLAACVVALQAQVVTLEFSGTFTHFMGFGKGGEGSLFGMPEQTSPFSGTITLDLGAAGAVAQLNIGDLWDTEPLLQKMYLFPAATVTAVNVVTGNRTWSLSEVLVESWNSTSYAFRADTDLTTVPSWFSIDFEDAGGNYFRVGQTLGGEGIWFDNRADLYDATEGTNGAGDFTVAAVPEPSTYAAIAGVCALGLAVWRRRAGRGAS